MKKSILKAVSVFFLAVAIAGCKNLLIIPENNENTNLNKTASICVNADSTARQIAPEGYRESITSITLTGKLNGGETQIIKTWESKATGGRVESAFNSLQNDPVIDRLETGEWEFTIICSNASGAVCSGTTSKTLAAGNNGSIHFDLESVSGNGNIEITLDYSSCTDSMRSVSKVVVQLKRTDGTVVEEAGTIIETPSGTTNDPNEQDPRTGIIKYTATVPNGSYILTFTIYRNDTEDTTIAAELVNVAKDYTTKGTITLKDLNKSYTIAYKYQVAAATGGSPEWKDIPASWFISGMVPFTYTKYDTITLPTANDILRPFEKEYLDDEATAKAYVFEGWHTEDGSVVVEIDGSKASGDKIFYAQWKPVELEKIEFKYKQMGSVIDTEIDLFDIVKIVPKNADISKLSDYITIENNEHIELDGNKIKVNNTTPTYWGLTVSATVNMQGSKNNKIDIILADTDLDTNGPVFTSTLFGRIMTDTSITEYEIPYGFTALGYGSNNDKVFDKVFDNYKNLETVTIPKSIKTIKGGAFDYHASIKNILFQEESECTTIEGGAFSQCHFIEEIDLPDSITTIGGNAFSGCTALKRIKLPENENFTEIARSAFSGCHVIDNVVVPDSVTTIGATAFSGCKKLKNITLSKNLTTIDDSVFQCESLTTITLPSKVETIGNYAFYYCSNLQSITMKSTTPPELGGSSVFPDSLQAIFVPSSCLGTYEDYCTYQIKGWTGDYTKLLKPIDDTNTKATSLDLKYKEACVIVGETLDFNKILTVTPRGASVEYSLADPTGSGATIHSEINPATGLFTGKPGSASDHEIVKVVATSGNISTGCIVVVSATGNFTNAILRELADVTPNLYYGSIYEYTIPTGFTAIGDGTYKVFEDATPSYAVLTVTIPETVTEIKKDAFNSSRLSKVKFSGECNITTIGVSAFNSSQLREFNSENSNSIIIPDSVKTIGERAFAYLNTKSTSGFYITLGKGIESIGDYAFSGCQTLKEVVINETTPPAITFGTFLFSESPSCVISVPNGSVEAYRNANGWEDLKDSSNNATQIHVVLNKETMKKVIPDADQSFSNTKTAVIPDGYTMLPDELFSSTRVETITVPASVEVLNTTFKNASSLITIKFLGTTPPKLKDFTYLFDGCSALEHIYVPDGTVEVEGVQKAIVDVYKEADGWMAMDNAILEKISVAP